MNVFIYSADILCDECGRNARLLLTQTGKAPADPDNESTYDSNDYPKGPYDDGGEESDCPQHCGYCRLFLENPLTEDGGDYVREAIEEFDSAYAAQVAAQISGDTIPRRSGDTSIIAEWRSFYSYLFEKESAS